MNTLSTAMLLFAFFSITASSGARAITYQANLSSTSPEKIARSSDRSFIGLRYRDLPKGVVDLGGWVVDFDPSTGLGRHTVAHVRQGSQRMLWLEKILRYDRSGRPTFQVINVLNIPNLSNGETFLTGGRTCLRNGRSDSNMAVVVRFTEVERWTPVRKAWRVNLRTKGFDEISTKGIACIQYAPGE